MARASRYTITPLDTYARLLGVNPIHFNGAAGASVWPDNGAAQDIWQQHSWQLKTETISREDLANAIYNAEMDIRAVLGYSIAPEYFANELHRYPQHHRRSMVGVSGVDTRGAGKSLVTRFGKVVAVGRRASSVIALGATVTYSDPDADGWSELATITVTSDITPGEVFIYFPGKSGDRTWEIRPVRARVAGIGTVVITVDSWLLINPTHWEHSPTTTEPNAIDVSTTSNYVTTVDVYRVYTDTTAASSRYSWEPTSIETDVTTQDGQLILRDGSIGSVVPQAANYDDGWAVAPLSVHRDPDQVALWYLAGNQSEDYLNGFTLNPLDDYLATAVMWLATARLDKPITGDGLLGNRVIGLQRDMTQNSRDKFFVLNIQTDIFINPF